MHRSAQLEIRPEADLVRVRVNLDVDVENFLRRLEYEHRVSKSSIVEAALRLLMVRAPEEIADVLHTSKAKLRRR